MGAAARRRGHRSMTAIVRLKVTLEDVEPEVMRRLDVPLKIRLDRLHLVLQVAMGWTDSHLYEFTAGGTGWGVPDADFGGGPMPAAKTTLADLIKDTGARTIHYLYDFGDGWDHVIKIERIGESDPQARYPQLVTAQGRCPPEDVGGPPGYAEFLAAIADPTHEEHDYMLTWCGGAFDPESPDVEHIADELDRLARRGAPRPRKLKTTSPRS
jgi:Plasmid pRiA4b ORF-3-like protein